MSKITVIVGDNQKTLQQIPDKSVQVIVTSPPYWGLRDYGYKDQLGLEPLHDCLAWARGEEPCGHCYVCNLRAVAKELHRVLRDDGVFWLNLGDSYCSIGHKKSNSGYGTTGLAGGKTQENTPLRRENNAPGLKNKDLVGIPWRVALALQSDGWWLRSAPPWIKRNGLPESVTDRPNTTNEYWFLLSKSKHYFYDHVAVREGLSNATIQDGRKKRGARGTVGVYSAIDGNCGFSENGRNRRTSDWYFESLGSLIDEQRAYLAHLEHVRENGGMLQAEDGTPLALDVTTKGFKGAHFAVFSPDLVEPIIKASTSKHGCCPTCGAPWKRIIIKEKAKARADNPNEALPYTADGSASHGVGKTTLHKTRRTYTAGWEPTCTCPEHEPVPCVVLDSFGGAGTTGLVADRLGVDAILLELNESYGVMTVDRIRKEAGMLANITLQTI